MDVKSLAESDEQEVVREVLEYFCDFVALGHHVFSFNMPNCGEVTAIWFSISFIVKKLNKIGKLN